MFAPGAERDAFKIGVGVKPNGLAFDPARGTLIAANIGDASIPYSHSVSVVDLARRERIAEVKVPDRTRWAIYDAAREMFFVNIASPARIVAIDARDPTKISKEYEVPAAGPHGLELDPATGRLLCACDAGVLFAIDAASGRVPAYSGSSHAHRVAVSTGIDSQIVADHRPSTGAHKFSVSPPRPPLGPPAPRRAARVTWSAVTTTI